MVSHVVVIVTHLIRDAVVGRVQVLVECLIVKVVLYVIK